MLDGNILKEARKERKMNQKKMAKILGISVSWLSKIENNKKEPSVELSKKINSFLKKNTINENKNKEKKYTKEQLKDMEREIIETYDLIRSEKNVFSKIAFVNRVLIDFNKNMEESFLKLDVLIDKSDEYLSKKINRSLKSTLKNLEIKKEKILSLLRENDILTIEEE